MTPLHLDTFTPRLTPLHLAQDLVSETLIVSKIRTKDFYLITGNGVQETDEQRNPNAQINRIL